MFDSAAQVLEEIAPEDKNRTAVASHLVKVQPENAVGREEPQHGGLFEVALWTMVMFHSQFGGFAARPGTSWLQAVRNSWRRAELNPPAISRLLGIGLRSSRDRFLFLAMQSTRAFWLIPLGSIEEKRPMRRQPDDHHFGSLIMLAVTAGAFLLVTWWSPRRFSCSSKSLRSLEW
jgi:hypothetical protein